MNAILPDVSLTETAPKLSPLEWVGMEGIVLPITVIEHGDKRDLHAKADLQVDLPAPHVKGIHMSRLYRLLNSGLGSGKPLAIASIEDLLAGMVETHKDCGSQNARMRMSFELQIGRAHV